ncbi:MAG: DNA internalization-related competence protein ComEC/Rec2 [Epulopiscium sp. Nele67-Bin005]|nr:MAG: DNA internalization-related competence protein ComEC/Rec2 [Epulopiscium sp. Nele67-Bin005]
MLDNERWLMQFSIFWVIGIALGIISWSYLNLLGILILCLGAIFFVVLKNKRYSIYCLALSLGILMTIYHPIITELQFWENQDEVVVQGVVEEISTNLYSTKVKLGNVKFWDEDKAHSKLYNVQIEISNYYAEPYSHLTEYDVVVIRGEVKAPALRYNPADMDYQFYLQGEGIVATITPREILYYEEKTLWLETFRNMISTQIDLVFENRDKGIVKSLVLGDKTDLDQETRDNFYELGIGHILVISGFHIGTLYIGIKKLFTILGFNYYERLVSTFGIIWGYGYIVRLSNSTMRACIVVSLMIIARCIYEEEDFKTSIAIAMYLVLIYNPFSLGLVSFQLSFGAVVAISIWQDMERAIRWRNRGKNYKISGYGISLTITLFLAPIISYHFYSVATLEVLVNILVSPIFGFLIIYIVVILASSFVFTQVARILGIVVILIIEILDIVVGLIVKLPFTSIFVGRPEISEILIYYILFGLIVISIITMKHQKIISLFAGAIIFSQIAIGWIYPPTLQITQLDIGQGDATVIVTPNNQLITIDSGTSYSTSKFTNHIHSLGHKTIDLAIVSHTDMDHVGGILHWLEKGNKINLLLVPPLNIENEIDAELLELCKKNQVEIKEVFAGDTVQIGDVMINILYPYTNYNDNKNANSIVCTVEYKQFVALFTGDIGQEEELKLAQLIGDIDILKVAHHGSKTSTAEQFLATVTPEFAIISCGRNNIYKHPHTDTLQTLENQGVEVFRTDRQGAIQIETDGKGYYISSFIKEEK